MCVYASHMLQGTPPTVTLRSVGRPVSRFRPVMVSEVPPALGPRSGDTPITNGSWRVKIVSLLLLFITQRRKREQ